MVQHQGAHRLSVGGMHGLRIGAGDHATAWGYGQVGQASGSSVGQSPLPAPFARTGGLWSASGNGSHKRQLGSKLGNQGHAADSIPSPVFPVGKRALVTLEQRQPVTRRIRVVLGVSRSTRRRPRHEAWRETAIFCCGPVIAKPQACEEREGFCAWRLSQASATQRRDRAGQPCISGGFCPDRQAVTVDGAPASWKRWAAVVRGSAGLWRDARTGGQTGPPDPSNSGELERAQGFIFFSLFFCWGNWNPHSWMRWIAIKCPRRDGSCSLLCRTLQRQCQWVISIRERRLPMQDMNSRRHYRPGWCFLGGAGRCNLKAELATGVGGNNSEKESMEAWDGMKMAR